MLALFIAVYASIELRGIFEKGSPPREAMKSFHFMLGLLMLALVCVRIAMRAIFPAPTIQPAQPDWQATLAKIAHGLLYALMIGMPILGWLILSASGKPIPFFGLELPALIAKNKDLANQLKEVHEAIGATGYFLIGSHAAAALFHHYVLRDNTLANMLPALKWSR
jgi:cytochrome b561